MTSSGLLSGISGEHSAIWDDRATPEMINASSKGFDSREVAFLLTQSTGRALPGEDRFHKVNTIVNRGLHREETPLSTLFFSTRNVLRVQCMLKEAVRKETGGKIEIAEQDASDLQMSMQTIFDESSQNIQTGVAEQVAALDYAFVDKFLPIIITNIKQELGYRRDINQRPVPMDNPVNVSSRGKRTLPSATTVWQNPSWQGTGGGAAFKNTAARQY
jgi:hypothetical protein